MEPRILAVPDFFVDVVMHPGLGVAELLEAIGETARLGGGNILVRGVVRPGGNAGNSARVLAALGRRVTLGVVGSSLHAAVARVMLRGVEVVHLGGSGECFSAILEVGSGERLVNIMFSDKGCLSPIGRGGEVDEALAGLLSRGWEACLAVNIAAWGSPRGASRLPWRRCRILLLDTSDARGRDYGELLEALRSMRGAAYTVISLNECELAYHARHLSARSPREALEALAEATGAVVCLHTPRSAVCEPGGVEQHNIFYTDNPATSTGAGDAWNAGLIDALLSGLSLRDALLHAHRVAACYVAKGAPCTRSQLGGARR